MWVSSTCGLPWVAFWKRFVSLKASILSTKIILYNDFELIDWKLSDVYVSPQPMVKWSRKMFWHTKIQRPFLWRYDFVDKSTPSTLVSHFKNTKTSGLNINCQDAGLLTVINDKLSNKHIASGLRGPYQSSWPLSAKADRDAELMHPLINQQSKLEHKHFFLFRMFHIHSYIRNSCIYL